MQYKPDFNRLLDAVTRKAVPDKVPAWELFADVPVIEAVLGEKLAPLDNADTVESNIKQLIRYQLKMGYDYLPIVLMPPFQIRSYLKAEDSAELSKGNRIWVDEHNGIIKCMEDFEKYPWPETSAISFKALEIAARLLPEGMKICFWSSGILENITWLMGYEQLAYATIDSPELVRGIADKVGSTMHYIYDTATKMDGVGIAAMGDDLGFKGSTLFSAEFLREYCFPWHKKIVDSVHGNGLRFILHSCGQLEGIMDDLIDYVGIDAKHSFEDVICPVTEMYDKYHDRIAIIGGIDIDFLSSSTPDEVRKRVRKTLDHCYRRGGYIMGTGNSVANYIPLENFLAMMDESNNYTV